MTLMGCLAFLVHTAGRAQNVGIGTSDPTRKLSVNGTVSIDHNATNMGTLDSASLLFGTNAQTGINSSNNALDVGFHGLDLWTNGIKRISITEGGYVGIGNANPLYKLHVGGSIVYFEQFICR